MNDMHCERMHAQSETRGRYNRFAGLDMQLDLNNQKDVGSAASEQTSDTTSQKRKSLPVALRLARASSPVFKESRGSRSSRQPRSSREEERTKPLRVVSAQPSLYGDGPDPSSAELGLAISRTSSSSSMITRTQSASSEMGISFYQLVLARTPSAAEPVADTTINQRISGPIVPYICKTGETPRNTRNIGSPAGFDIQKPLKPKGSSASSSSASRDSAQNRPKSALTLQQQKTQQEQQLFLDRRAALYKPGSPKATSAADCRPVTIRHGSELQSTLKDRMDRVVERDW